MVEPQSWTEVREALRDLHRALVEAVRRDYERERHAVFSAGEFLHLVTGDPYFAWLHPISELMVDLDVLLETDPGPSADEAAGVRTEIEYFISPPSGAAASGEFVQRYLPYVAADPHVGIAHVRLKQALQRLPLPVSVDEAEVLHDRHTWAELRSHRK
jgi:hypothetical protein